MKLCSTHSRFFKTGFSQLQVPEVFEIFQSLLNLFKIVGPKNKILLLPNLFFLKGNSKSICDLLLQVFPEEIAHLHGVVKSPSNI